MTNQMIIFYFDSYLLWDFLHVFMGITWSHFSVSGESQLLISSVVTVWSCCCRFCWCLLHRLVCYHLSFVSGLICLWILDKYNSQTAGAADFSREFFRGGKPIRSLSLQSGLAQSRWRSWAPATVASYLAPFLELFVDVPFCLPTSHAVIDLVSAAWI